MSKQYVALARVSSREQEREGFSLEVQDDALHRYAKAQGGDIVQFWRIAETASKAQHRGAFKELIAYAKVHARTLAGVLFFKVDRAARNLFDYVELERLETEHHVPVIYVSQPTENSPAGRMMRRTLANMAAFYTEQQSLDVRDGHARRIQAGLFVSLAPYGYRNVRKDGRGLIELDPATAPVVRRAFELYAYHNHTVDSLIEQLEKEGLAYAPERSDFNRAKLYSILKDRSYLGEVRYHGQWYPGGHEPLVDRPTFQRVQARMERGAYLSHELTYAGQRVACAHCGSPVTGEIKTKQTSAGPKQYVYYRCTKYTAAGHPRVRVTEAQLDQQVLSTFERLKIKDERVRAWFEKVLRARTREARAQTEQRAAELNRQLTTVKNQQDRLLNLRLLDQVDEATFAAKSTELRDRIAELSSQVQASEGERRQQAAAAEKAFELSQTLQDRWFSSNCPEKRQLLDLVCLNLHLSDVTLEVQMRKPFDVLAEGLPVLSSRGDKI